MYRESLYQPFLAITGDGMRWKYHILYHTWSQTVAPFLVLLTVLIPDVLQMFGSAVGLALQETVLSHTIHNNIVAFDKVQFNVAM
jgi:hypothetical protein